jgi:hypothetical protein
MAFNGSDLINEPFNTTFQAYTHFFGMAFFIIPIAFIGAALFLKTRDTALLAAYFIISSAFLMVGSAFVGDEQASVIFALITAISIGTLMYSVFYGGK